MGLFEATKKMLIDSGLTDAQIYRFTGVPERWIQRFRTKDSHKEILSRIEKINKCLAKEEKKRKRELNKESKKCNG